MHTVWEWRIPDILESEVTLTHIFLLSFSLCYLLQYLLLDVAVVLYSLRWWSLLVGRTFRVLQFMYIAIASCYFVPLYGQTVFYFLFSLAFSLHFVFYRFFDFSASNIPFFTQQGIEIGIRVRGFILPKYYNLMLVSYIAYWIYRLQFCKFFSIYTN